MGFGGPACRRFIRAWTLAATLVAAHAASAFTLAFTDRVDGIACQHVDLGLGLPWHPTVPRWIDAKGVPGGRAAFAVHRIDAGDASRVRRIDITSLVRAWWTGAARNEGVLLRHLSGEVVIFHAREHADFALRPTLALTWGAGQRKLLEAKADASLDCSTYKALGAMDSLLLGPRADVALRFDLKQDPALPTPSSAELWLTRTPQGLGNPSMLEVQRLHLPLGDGPSPRTDGIAQRHPRDQGIERDADVLFVDRFDAGGPAPAWTQGERANLTVVQSDPANGLQPFDGPALRVVIDRGSQLGADLRYKFKKAQGAEPEEIHFRYYLWLGRSWRAAIDGGKLPGLAGTYGAAGWGGRGWDGNKGWSLRGSYGLPAAEGHPASGHLILGTYAYHAKAGSLYGEGLPWIDSGGAGLIALERWVCIEQYVKMNTPGRYDGVLQVWVDGRPVLTRTDLRLRDLPSIRIEEVWMNVFHGGTQASPSPMVAYIDNVVIARRYIGPLRP